MYLLFALVALGIGVATSPGSIADVPLSQLTLNKIFEGVFSAVCYAGAAYFAYLSLANDRIWPWRWTLRYVGNLVVRCAFMALFGYGLVAIIERKQPDGWLLLVIVGGGGILILYTLFSSEFELFKDKLEGEDSKQQH